MINVDKRQRTEFLDTYWLEILFFLIGEHADQHAHQVNNDIFTSQQRFYEISGLLFDFFLLLSQTIDVDGIEKVLPFR